jgi:hypothetical protein
MLILKSIAAEGESSYNVVLEEAGIQRTFLFEVDDAALRLVTWSREFDNYYLNNNQIPALPLMKAISAFHAARQLQRLDAAPTESQSSRR